MPLVFNSSVLTRRYYSLWSESRAFSVQYQRLFRFVTPNDPGRRELRLCPVVVLSCPCRIFYETCVRFSRMPSLYLCELFVLCVSIMRVIRTRRTYVGHVCPSRHTRVRLSWHRKGRNLTCRYRHGFRPFTYKGRADLSRRLLAFVRGQQNMAVVDVVVIVDRI